jgi:hypothetical protein
MTATPPDFARPSHKQPAPPRKSPLSVAESPGFVSPGEQKDDSHLNPKSPISGRKDFIPWSSCRAHALGEANPLLAKNPNYLEMGATPARRQERWREFMLGEDPKGAAIARQDGVRGAADFRAATPMHRSRAAGRGRGRPRKMEAEGGISS